MNYTTSSIHKQICIHVYTEGQYRSSHAFLLLTLSLDAAVFEWDAFKNNVILSLSLRQYPCEKRENIQGV